MFRFSTVMFVTLTTLGTGGCRKVEQLFEATRAVAAQSSDSKGEADAALEQDALLSAKLSKYVTCINTTTSSAFRSRSYYLQYIDEKVGPSIVGGRGPTSIDTEECFKALEAARQARPALPDIEAAALTYKKTVDTLVPLIKQAADYYRQGDDKDDQLARGKAMHGPLLQAFNDFREANRTFEGLVTTQNDAAAERRTSRLEKEPARRLEFLTEKTLLTGKTLLRKSDVRDLKEVDVAQYTEALDAFGKNLAELDRYAETEKKPNEPSVSSFVADGKELQIAAKDLLRRRHDGRDFNKDSLAGVDATMVQGHPARVIERYNSFIDAANRLTF